MPMTATAPRVPSAPRCRARLALIPILAVLGLHLGGCAPKTSDKSLVFVDVAEAEQLLQGRRRLLGLGGERAGIWVDPRSERDYRAGHIAGAVRIEPETLKVSDPRLVEFDVILVYGDGYNSPIAIAMSKGMLAKRFRDVRTLRGGLSAWERAGNPVVTGPTPDGE
jgi:rhodanese-related sulfurtransferase